MGCAVGENRGTEYKTQIMGCAWAEKCKTGHKTQALMGCAWAEIATLHDTRQAKIYMMGCA